MNIPEVGDATPKRGSKVTKKVVGWLFQALGWRYEGTLPNVPKLVLVGAPHTSNWDFFLAMGVMFSLDIHMSWLAKHTFVNGPFGSILRRLGGIPVDRTAAHGLVEQIVQEYKRREHLFLAISPEGTRSKVRRWRTGFYYIAMGANVPILPVVADYGRKVIALCEPIWPSGNIEEDMARLQANFSGVFGKRRRFEVGA